MSEVFARQPGTISRR